MAVPSRGVSDTNAPRCPVTRAEIQLVVFILSALLIGAGVQWWRGSEARNLQIPAATTPAPAKWARPPYVFKSQKDAREAHEKALKEK